MNLLSDRFFSRLQYILPKFALTVLAGRLASLQAGSLTTNFIRWYIGRYNVDMTEAAVADIASYATFQDFFYQTATIRCASAGGR